MNPEFLTEGQSVEDFMYPDRLVLGGIDERSIECLDALYAGFEGVPRLRVKTRTAEMIKYASNALLATSISFANRIIQRRAASHALGLRSQDVKRERQFEVDGGLPERIVDRAVVVRLARMAG